VLDDGEGDRIRSHLREIVRTFLEEPGFIGSVTGFQGGCGFTVTAWEDEAAMHRGLARQHRTAMRELRKSDLAPGVWTGVWQPLRINRIWTRCAACTSLEDVTDDHRTCGQCGALLEERPPFW
jgi:quinol monooxygenase YgiN